MKSFGRGVDIEGHDAGKNFGESLLLTLREIERDGLAIQDIKISLHMAPPPDTKRVLSFRVWAQ